MTFKTPTHYLLVVFIHKMDIIVDSYPQHVPLIIVECFEKAIMEDFWPAVKWMTCAERLMRTALE